MIPKLRLWLNAFAPAEAVIPCSRGSKGQHYAAPGTRQSQLGRQTNEQCGWMYDSPGIQPAGAASISCPLQSTSTKSGLGAVPACHLIHANSHHKGTSAAASCGLLLISSIMPIRADQCMRRQQPHLVQVSRRAGSQQKQQSTLHLWAQVSTLPLQATVQVVCSTLPVPCACLHMQGQVTGSPKAGKCTTYKTQSCLAVCLR